MLKQVIHYTKPSGLLQATPVSRPFSTGVCVSFVCCNFWKYSQPNDIVDLPLDNVVVESGVPILRLRLRRIVSGRVARTAAQPDGGRVRVALLERGAVDRGRGHLPRPAAQSAHRRPVLAGSAEPPQGASSVWCWNQQKKTDKENPPLPFSTECRRGAKANLRDGMDTIYMEAFRMN